MKKTYQVFYWIKQNKHEYLNHIFIKATNAKEACKTAKEVVKNKTGKNAFRPTTKVPSQEELERFAKNSYYVIR